jgi:hypothetical protein
MVPLIASRSTPIKRCKYSQSAKFNVGICLIEKKERKSFYDALKRE